jgi:hypothetical protein
VRRQTLDLFVDEVPGETALLGLEEAPGRPEVHAVQPREVLEVVVGRRAAPYLSKELEK